MSATLKRALSWIGSALGILSVAFVGLKLFTYSHQLPINTTSPAQWLGVGALSLVYGASGFLLALAWRDIMQHLGVGIRRDWAVWAYGVSQLAKYVPGNVFHLAGRQAIGVSAGVPPWPLGKSMAWELGVLAATAALFALLIMPSFFALSTALASLIFASATALSILLIRRFFGSSLARAVTLQFVFLAFSGVIFATLFKLLGGDWNVITICGAYVIAWLIGLVTPGAPAGVGIRETVLFFLLHESIGQADLLGIILIGRLVTTSGDLIFFIVASRYFTGRPTGLLTQSA